MKSLDVNTLYQVYSPFLSALKEAKVRALGAYFHLHQTEFRAFIVNDVFIFSQVFPNEICLSKIKFNNYLIPIFF